MPPAALAIHLAIGQVYAFSVFKIPLSQLIGGAKPANGDWKQTQIAWIFSFAIVMLGLSAAAFGKWLEGAGPRKAMFAGGGLFCARFYADGRDGGAIEAGCGDGAAGQGQGQGAREVSDEAADRRLSECGVGFIRGAGSVRLGRGSRRLWRCRLPRSDGRHRRSRVPGERPLTAVPRAAPPFVGPMAAPPLADPMAGPPIARQAAPTMAAPTAVPPRFIAGAPTTAAPPSELAPASRRVWRSALQPAPRPRPHPTTIRRLIISRRRGNAVLVRGPEMSDLLETTEGGIAWLTLNRPDRLNAFSPAMLAGFGRGAAAPGQRCRQSARSSSPAPDAGFCAGGDVKTMESRAAQGFEERVEGLRRMHQLPMLLRTIPKVVIAMVNGPAVGAGLGLALACDLRIAGRSARFGTGFAGVGYSGDFGGSWTLTRLVGTAKARELYFLGEVIDSAAAASLGLVNRVVEDDVLHRETMTLARRIADGPRVAYGYMKRNLFAAETEPFAAVLEMEAVHQARTAMTEDHQRSEQGLRREAAASLQRQVRPLAANRPRRAR